MSQSEIMKHEVFLVGMLQDQNRQKLTNLRCIIFARPIEANMKLIRDELMAAKYQAYSLYFTNVLQMDMMDRIASQDKNELVKHVYEYFADYVALDKILFTLNIPSFINMINSAWGEASFNRLCEGLLAVLLSMKKARPFIRYQKNSDLCRNIAEAVNEKIDAEKDLFQIPQSEARKVTPPLLLLLDRREDPITPLLTQWTYQAMLHELCQIKNNRVIIKGEKEDNASDQHVIDFNASDEDDEDVNDQQKKKEDKSRKDKEVVVNAELDSFFEKHWASNWGDLCEAVKSVIEEFKVKNQVKDTITSINDIQQFMRDYPQFKKFAGEVDKHASLVQECRRQISLRHLLDVSELEQDMACSDNHSEHIRTLKNLLNNKSISNYDALRLVLIYAFKYENSKGELQSLKNMLKERGCKSLNIINSALKFAPRDYREEESANARVSTFFLSALAKKAISAFQDDNEVQNVFTQHKPRLHTILDSLFKNQLSESMYPFYSLTSREIPRDVIVFIVGGATYEEALTVHKFNLNQEDNTPTGLQGTSSVQTKRDRSVVLGGSTVLNSKMFLAELSRFHKQLQQDSNLL
jgi:vacuolar protein sorting-associated protein 45